MPLPDFNAQGLLPDGVHAGDANDLHERCVDGSTSTTRASIFKGLQDYQADIAALGLNVTQWVDGSFVDATRTNPEDIDLANFSHATELNSLTVPQQVNAGALMNGRESTKAKYSCHTFLVVVFPVGHAWESQTEKLRAYWRQWFSSARDYSRPGKPEAPHRGRKGLVEMRIGDPNLCPVLSHAH